MGSVKVAVRVRPFIQREIDLGTPLSVKMHDKSTTILDFAEDGKRTKTFAYDHSFWSHDGFEVDEKGLYIPAD